MSYTKDLESYPEEFGLLIETGATKGVSLPMPTPAEAKRLQGRLYAYKGALKKACHDDPEATDEVRALFKLSQRCQMRIEGSLLVLRPLDQDPDAALIKAALGLAGEQPPKTQMAPNGQVLVPINPAHLPPWLAELAVKRAESVPKT